MVIAGIWHGAGRQFLAFGLLHGVFICINHAWRTFAPKWSAALGSGRLGAATCVLITFVAVVSAQIFFRADSVQDAFSVLRGAIGMNGLGRVPYTGTDLLPWAALGLLFGMIWWFPNTQEILGQYSAEERAETDGSQTLRLLRWQPTWKWSAAICAALFACFVLMKPASRFLYFQF
jgi:hypothetical protein